MARRSACERALDQISARRAAPAEEVVTVRGIWLVRVGDTAEVRVELKHAAGWRWHTICREAIDGPFSHIVEPSGIAGAPERAAEEPRDGR